jgi:hypothetical protein
LNSAGALDRFSAPAFAFLPFGPIVLRDGKRRDELRRLTARMELQK